MRYEIRIQEHLSHHRLHHFEVEAIRQEASGETVIIFSCRDQSAFFGLLYWLQNLGATLLYFKRLEETLDQ